MGIAGVTVDPTDLRRGDVLTGRYRRARIVSDVRLGPLGVSFEYIHDAQPERTLAGFLWLNERVPVERAD